MTRACDNCCYWDYVGDGSEGRSRKRGRCRINPPRIVEKITISDGGTGWWPLTNADDWCGKFERKNGAD